MFTIAKSQSSFSLGQTQLPHTLLPGAQWQFRDDFESDERNGFWRGGVNVDFSYQDPTDVANTVMALHFGANSEGSGDSWSQAYFDLGVDAVQLEIGWRFHLPQTFSPIDGFQELFSVYSGTAGTSASNVSIGSKAWTSSAGAIASIHAGHDGNDYGHSMNEGGGSVFSADSRDWTSVRVVVELAERKGDIGRMDLYVNNKLVTSTHDPDLISSYSGAPEGPSLIQYSEQGNFLDRGALFGWANGEMGFTEDQTVLVDDVFVNANTAFGEVDWFEFTDDGDDLPAAPIVSGLSNAEWKFSDNFEGTRDGSFWLGNGINVDYGVVDPTDPTNRVMAMTYVAGILPSGDAHTEYDFHIPIEAVQLEMGWRMFVPQNYISFERNHKISALWSGDYGTDPANVWVSNSVWGSEDGATPSLFLAEDGNRSGHYVRSGQPLMLDNTAGAWLDYRVVVELAEFEGDFGRADFFLNDELVTSTHLADLIGEEFVSDWNGRPDSDEMLAHASRGNFIDQGTVLGWANGDEGGRVTEDMTFLVDDFYLNANSTFDDMYWI